MKGGGNPEHAPAAVNPVVVSFPGAGPGPLRTLAIRLGLAIFLIVLVALLTYAGRDGYVDPQNDEITLLDAFYYSTVSITTTGYGDVRPESDSARWVTTLIVTPARVLFLILLIGTTLEILAERSRSAYRLARWRRKLRDHTIVCGYGTKGRAAVRTLLAQGADPNRIVVIDDHPGARENANLDNLVAISGNAASQQVLEQADIREAESVIVAVNRDDTAVLVTLTARELCRPGTSITAAVREEQNVHLLHQSGADSVITSSEAAGRLLGLANTTPALVEVLEDLLAVGSGLDIVEHVVDESEAGPLADCSVQGPVLGMVRDGQLIRYDDPRIQIVEPGDRLVELKSHR